MDPKNIDVVGEAVTQKIREAITAKLVELGVLFEKELPDYIMVMVANKKSRAQMELDLFLFLGDGTTEFMDWFENIMKKFQSNSVKQLDEVSFSDSKGSTTSSTGPALLKGSLETNSLHKSHHSCNSESDVLTLEVPEQDADFLGEDLKDVTKSSSISLSSRQRAANRTCAKTSDTTAESTSKELTIPKKGCLAVADSSFSLQQKSRIVPCSAVIPVKRLKTTAESDSEAIEQPFGSVASIIRVTERKSSVPLSLQANKLLLLKAVDAANKSVLAQQKPLRSQKSSQEDVSVDVKSDLSSEKDTRIAVLDDVEQSTSSVALRRKLVGSNSSYFLPESGHQKLNIIYPAVMSKLTDLPPSDTEIAYDTPDHSFGDGASQVIKTSNSSTSRKIDKACATEKETAKSSVNSPRFVVTLDGIDPNTLKRKSYCEVPMDIDSDETCYPRAVLDADAKEFIPIGRSSTSPVEKKLKLNEKCRYWPACKSGDLCNYHHPTTTCKAFPKCTYGDKCLFIHPNCKFDALCSRKDCPYTHASKRKIAVAEVPSPNRSSLAAVFPCKYFPNCTSKNCTFFHPKMCWYGSQCKLPSCPYTHSLPVRDQLKWCAQ